MSRTVTALYDTRAEAEAALSRLRTEVDLDTAEIIDQDFQAGEGRQGLDELYLTEEDRAAYGEGIRRGGFMLSAEVGTGQDPDHIIAVLEESASIDLDERQQLWRSEGWTPGATYGAGAAADFGSQPEAFVDQGETAGDVVEEERVPVYQEELRVGKREVARGGARVRSYIREVPVNEQVELREEHLTLERRPVEERLSESDLAASDLLQERVIEVSEMKEEAVVNKEAVVREELVIKKTVEQHSEQIADTVRRTEVEVEELPGGGEQRSAFSGFDRGGGTDRTG